MKIDITDIYTDISIFFLWYSSWNLLDMIFQHTLFSKWTLVLILIFMLALVLLYYRNKNTEPISICYKNKNI